MADIFSAADWVAALLFAGALAMTALSDKELRAAKLFVWIAVVLCMARWGVWAVITDSAWPIRAVVGALMGGFVFAAVPSAFQWISDHSKREIVDLIDGGVFIEVRNMQSLPDVFPPEGAIHVFYVTPEAMANGVPNDGMFPSAVSVQKMTGNPGTKINWPPSPSPFSKFAPVLDITNDTGGPLLDLVIPIRVAYGSPPLQRILDNNLILIRLEAGASNRHSIVIFNRSPDGAGMSFGDVATAHRPGAAQKEVKLIKPLSNPISQLVMLTPFQPEGIPIPKDRPK
jgi:hypothetical protein